MHNYDEFISLQGKTIVISVINACLVLPSACMVIVISVKLVVHIIISQLFAVFIL